jgi:hypothetical protein
VNLAVNNLLSRDEEDGDDQEEGESYIPGGKLSLQYLSLVKLHLLTPGLQYQSFCDHSRNFAWVNSKF